MLDAGEGEPGKVQLSSKVVVDASVGSIDEVEKFVVVLGSLVVAFGALRDVEVTEVLCNALLESVTVCVCITAFVVVILLVLFNCLVDDEEVVRSSEFVSDCDGVDEAKTVEVIISIGPADDVSIPGVLLSDSGLVETVDDDTCVDSRRAGFAHADPTYNKQIMCDIDSLREYISNSFTV